MKLATTLLVALTITFCLQTQTIDGANILGVCLSSSPSHLIVNMAIMRALAEKGHNITMVSTLKPKLQHANIHSLVIPPSEKMEKALAEQMNQVAGKKKSMLSGLMVILDKNSPLMRVQYETVTDPRFTALYENKSNKFDVAILAFFMNDFQLAVAAKLKVPVIMTWSGAPNLLTDAYVGNPSDSIFMPANGFLERAKYFVMSVMFSVVKILLSRTAESLYYDLLGSERDSLPTYQEMKRNCALLFVNSHFSEGLIRPNMPSLVEIGGIQIKEKADPLPKEIAELLNKSSTHGAILFSLGSNVKSDNVQPETNAKLFKVLSNLKQNVIWKWDGLSQTPGNSSNMLYLEWLPQDDILAHPNLKLFITHAGKGGIAEAQYHGVPLLALPMFAEQDQNADKLVLDGYGLQADIHNFDEAAFNSALESVLNNPKYAQNIQRFSKIYRDRSLTAQQSVVYWTEYVVRHHGAAHMQSPLKQLNFFQAASWDVIGFLSLILYVVWRILKFIVVFTCVKIFGKRKQKPQKSANKVKKH